MNYIPQRISLHALSGKFGRKLVQIESHPHNPIDMEQLQQKNWIRIALQFVMIYLTVGSNSQPDYNEIQPDSSQEGGKSTDTSSDKPMRRWAALCISLCIQIIASVFIK